MDAVSYSLASKQAQRIEKFIENPDSTSGIVTVPKTIASGETITVPAGRIAVLPNIQVDGTLTVLGDVFIPTGSTMSQVIPRVTSTDNAIVRFNGTTGAVQDSKVVIDDGGNVGIGITPAEKLHLYSNTASNVIVKTQNSVSSSQYGLDNAGFAYAWSADAPRMYIGTNKSDGYLSFYAGGERMRIDSAGRVTMPYQPAFQAQAINSDTTYGIGYVPYPNIIFNHGNYYNASTSTFTAPVTGVYFFSWSTWHNEASTGRTYLHKNNAAYKSTGTDDGPHVRLSNADVTAYGSAQMLVELNANDTVRIYNGEGNIRLFYANAFSGYLIG